LDQTIDASLLWHDDSRNVIAELKAGTTLDERCKIVERFLLRMLDKFRKEETQAEEALKLIRNSKGILSVDEICNKTGFNQKQLERKFLKLLGTTPKVFSRICRFLHICQQLDELKGKTLTQVAYDCGYYDQSHFINEFKEFSGFTPKEFFAKQHIWFTEI
jgi:AraC-like DNA-binding protein